MKIDDSIKKTTPLGSGSAGQATSAGKAPSKAAETVSSTPSVNVNLSSQSQTLSENMSDSTVFDTKKVEEIKAAIADGQFKVDTGKVADSLIETVQNLLQRRTA